MSDHIARWIISPSFHYDVWLAYAGPHPETGRDLGVDAYIKRVLDADAACREWPSTEGVKILRFLLNESSRMVLFRFRDLPAEQLPGVRLDDRGRVTESAT